MHYYSYTLYLKVMHDGAKYSRIDGKTPPPPQLLRILYVVANMIFFSLLAHGISFDWTEKEYYLFL